LTLARRLGQAVLAARARHADPVEAVCAVTQAQVLFRGKIVDVRQRTERGFARGQFVVSGSDGASLAVDFQNENLIARRDGEVVAVVPDLICTVAVDDGEPITTERLRYGLRVAVLGIPAPAILRAPEALQFIGPRAFGYDLDYRQPLPGSYPNA
jgi:uncharacterized protein